MNGTASFPTPSPSAPQARRSVPRAIPIAVCTPRSQTRCRRHSSEPAPLPHVISPAAPFPTASPSAAVALPPGLDAGHAVGWSCASCASTCERQKRLGQMPVSSPRLRLGLAPLPVALRWALPGSLCRVGASHGHSAAMVLDRRPGKPHLLGEAALSAGGPTPPTGASQPRIFMHWPPAATRCRGTHWCISCASSQAGMFSAAVSWKVSACCTWSSGPWGASSSPSRDFSARRDAALKPGQRGCVVPRQIWMLEHIEAALRVINPKALESLGRRMKILNYT